MKTENVLLKSTLSNDALTTYSLKHSMWNLYKGEKN